MRRPPPRRPPPAARPSAAAVAPLPPPPCAPLLPPPCARLRGSAVQQGSALTGRLPLAACSFARRRRYGGWALDAQSKFRPVDPVTRAFATSTQCLGPEFQLEECSDSLPYHPVHPCAAPRRAPRRGAALCSARQRVRSPRACTRAPVHAPTASACRRAPRTHRTARYYDARFFCFEGVERTDHNSICVALHDTSHGLSNAFSPEPAIPQLHRSMAAPPLAEKAEGTAAEYAARRAARTPGAVFFAREAPVGVAVAVVAAAALFALVGVRRALAAARSAAAAKGDAASGPALL